MKVLPPERGGTESAPSQDPPGVADRRAKVSALQAWGRRWARRYEGLLWLKPALVLGYRRTIEAVVRSAGLAPGHRVLDLAAGTGVTSRLVSPLIAPGGSVVAVDISPELVGRGRGLAAAAGVTNIQWVLGEASQLPLRDASVDAVVSTGAFHLFPRPRASLTEMARVLRPGGAMALHSAPRRFPYTFMHRLLRRDLRAAVELHAPSELQTWAERASFVDVEVMPVPLGWLLRGLKP